MNSPLTMPQLASAWRTVKAAEDAAKAERLKLEEAIVALVPHQDEGTVNQDGVAVTFKVTRTVDTERLQAAWHELPEAAQQLFRWKADIDTRAMRGAQQVAPAAYKTAAEFITAKPAKPSVAIKE